MNIFAFAALLGVTFADPDVSYNVITDWCKSGDVIDIVEYMKPGFDYRNEFLIEGPVNCSLKIVEYRKVLMTVVSSWMTTWQDGYYAESFTECDNHKEKIVVNNSFPQNSAQDSLYCYSGLFVTDCNESNEFYTCEPQVYSDSYFIPISMFGWSENG